MNYHMQICGFERPRNSMGHYLKGYDKSEVKTIFFLTKTFQSKLSDLKQDILSTIDRPFATIKLFKTNFEHLI